MTISEFIKDLQESLAKNGDLPVWIYHEWGSSVDGVEEPNTIGSTQVIFLEYGKENY